MTAKDVILVLASIYIVRCDHACVTTLIPRDLVLITNYNSKVLTQKLSIDASGFCSWIARLQFLQLRLYQCASKKQESRKKDLNTDTVGANYKHSTEGTDDNPNTGTWQRGGLNEDGEDSAGELEQPKWGGRPRDSSKEHEHSVQKLKVYWIVSNPCSWIF